MSWQEICQQFPHNWVVVEAIDATTQDGQRMIDQMKLIDKFGSNWESAWEFYKQVHHVDKDREYYVLHTDREDLNIGVIDAFGRVIS